MGDGSRPTSIALTLTLALAIGASGATGQSAERFSFDDVDFLSGCWAGTMGSLEVREYWTESEGGAMLSNTRFLRDGVVVDWEFGRMIEGEDGVILWPYPRGQISAHGFPLVRIEDGEYVFENLEHDFPVRIIYVRDGDEGLNPRIEGTDGQGPGWVLRRVVCPG